MTEMTEFKMKGTFGVRNDKFRELLVETLQMPDGKQYLFGFHDQPISKHCHQLQAIVIWANIQRAKKLNVDMTDFLHEYVRASDGCVMFSATKLKSVVDQIEKVYTMRINKEIVIVKRRVTVDANKQAKIAAKNAALRERYQSAEDEFQAERARRIERLFGGPSAFQATSTAVSGAFQNLNATSTPQFVRNNGRSDADGNDDEMRQ